MRINTVSEQGWLEQVGEGRRLKAAVAASVKVAMGRRVSTNQLGQLSRRFRPSNGDRSVAS